MSTVVTVEKVPLAQEHEAPVQAKEEMTWSEVMRELGYPESWGETIRNLLAAEGKVFHWRKVSD